ncbi:hypothetical protein ABBQ38_008727 [Trebouxia sp. C0009 RCD-2024]
MLSTAHLYVSAIDTMYTFVVGRSIALAAICCCISDRTFGHQGVPMYAFGCGALTNNFGKCHLACPSLLSRQIARCFMLVLYIGILTFDNKDELKNTDDLHKPAQLVCY